MAHRPQPDIVATVNHRMESGDVLRPRCCNNAVPRTWTTVDEMGITRLSPSAHKVFNRNRGYKPRQDTHWWNGGIRGTTYDTA